MSKVQVSFVLVLRGSYVLNLKLVKASIMREFGFSRQYLDGNKVSKGMCEAEEERDKGLFPIQLVSTVVKFFRTVCIFSKPVLELYFKNATLVY